LEALDVGDGCLFAGAVRYEQFLGLRIWARLGLCGRASRGKQRYQESKASFWFQNAWYRFVPPYLSKTIMAEAASQDCILPRSVSFKATNQILEAFQPVIAHQGHWGIQHRQEPYQQLLKAIATHRVADRQDRFVPRMTKRRPKNYNRLTKPRKEIKLAMIK
jgi:hypothetical protein